MNYSFLASCGNVSLINLALQDIMDNKVKFILESLARHLKVKGIRGLATHLGAKESKLYSWVSRGIIGDKPLLLAKIPNLNEDFLDSAEGEIINYEMADEKDNKLVSITYLRIRVSPVRIGPGVPTITMDYEFFRSPLFCFICPHLSTL